jgi:hypothetical protein
VNAANAADALFLKVFSGEVLSSFERSAVTLDKHFVRTISSGKSAQFPVMGRSGAAYHSPGAEIVGTTLNHNEKVISINGLLLSQHFIANIDEAMNHYDVRSVYSQSMGEALAQQWDLHVLQTMTQAAAASANVSDSNYAAGTIVSSTNSNTVAADLIKALFDAAAQLDQNYVPTENRYAYLKPAQYYLLANATTAINKDYNGSGSIASGTVYEIAGFKLVKTPHLPTTNVTGTGTDAGGSGGGQVADSRNTVAICAHTSAVGTVKLMDLAFESAYDIRRQGTLMVAKYAAGHGVLRPEAVVRIRTAAP